MHYLKLLTICAKSVGLKGNVGKIAVVNTLRDKYGYEGKANQVLRQHLLSLDVPEDELPSALWAKATRSSNSSITERTDWDTSWEIARPEGDPPWDPTE